MFNNDNQIVINIGCRLNAYESSVIKKILKSLNMENFIVVNTCAITAESEKQCRQEIRKTKRKYPEYKIIVTGCASEFNKKKFYEMNEINFIVPNEVKLQPEIYKLILESKTKNKMEVLELISKLKIDSKEEIDRFNDDVEVVSQDRSRAFVMIQTGCNHYCSFCIVPFTRGKMQSREPEKIISEIQNLIKNNYNEIVLTGVDITDYGTDFAGKRLLSELCEKILKETNLGRLRLSSVDPSEIDEKLLSLFAKESRFMPYFHLSMQSGNNNILKKMRRRHTRENLIEFCQNVKNLRPETTFGADIITGFANENEDEFMDSLNLVENIPITFVHAFPYSKRPSTLAYNWPDNLELHEKKRRVNLLINAGRINLLELYKKMNNTIQKCVVEKGGNAKAENFISIKIENNDQNIGKIFDIKCHFDESENLLKGDFM